MNFREIALREAKGIYTELTTQLYEQQMHFYDENAIKHFCLFNNATPVCFGSVFITQEDSVYSIGNFQSIENLEYSKIFFQNLFLFLKTIGCNKLIGPMHGTTWNPYRFSEELKDPFFTEYEHKSYYPDYWRKSGFGVEQTYYTNIAPINKELKDQLSSNYFAKNNFKIEEITELTSKKAVNDIFTFVNKYFSRNSYFTTLNFDDFKRVGTSYIELFKGKFSQLVYDDEQLVGMFLATRDYSTPKRALVRTISRHPDKKYIQLPIEMSKRFYLQLIDGDYESQLHAYFHEKNPSRKVSQNFGGKIYRKHSLFSLKFKE